MRTPRPRGRVAVLLVAVAAMIAALLPAATAMGAHGDQLALQLTIADPGGPGDDAIVSNDVEFRIVATNTSDSTLGDLSLGLDLPPGVAAADAAATNDDTPDCVSTRSPDVLCELGDLGAGATITLSILGDASGRAAGSMTGVAYATWDDVAALSTIDTAELANGTLDLELQAETEDSVTFTLINTTPAADPSLPGIIENVVVEIAVPNPDGQVTATATEGTCQQIEQAGGNVICQDIALTTDETVTIEVGGLANPGIIAETNAPAGTRAELQLNENGDIVEDEEHQPAARAAGDTGSTREGTSKFGFLLNEEAIALPANQFTPIGGEVNYSINDQDNTGSVQVTWQEGDTFYEYQTTGFRNLKPKLGYFQDGGVNFDTHQHDETFRPNGPDAIPDLWVQWLVYAEGVLTVLQPDGDELNFDNVGVHVMLRQIGANNTEDAAWQHWSEKRGIPEGTVDYDGDGPAPPLPKNLTLVDVLFANTPTEGGECAFNGVAGDTCNPALGKFVRLMSYVFSPRTEGFNSSGITLGGSATEDYITRFDSSLEPLAGESAVKVSLEASINTFATRATAGDDDRPVAQYVVLGRNDIFADSLAGSGLASDNGPILFTPSNALNPIVHGEIRRVLGDGDGAKKVYLLGGTAALAPSIAEDLREEGYNVERLGGATRIETAARVAAEIRELNPDATEQMVAQAYGGEDVTQAWADAVSGGPYAAEKQIPLVLTRTEELVPEAAQALDSNDTTYVLGGRNSLSEEVLEEVPNGVRIAGPTRVETSIEVAKQLFDRTTATAGDEFVISPGYEELGWAYGLAAAPFAAVNDAPLLLLNTGEAGLNLSVRNYLESLGFDRGTQGYAFVSSSVVSSYIATEVEEILLGQN